MLKSKIIWWIIFAILIAIGISLLGDNHGHVIIVRTPYRIQFSFNLLLLLIVVGFFVMHYALRLMGYFRKMPSRWRARQEIKHLKAKQGTLLEAVQAMASDDFVRAESIMKKVQTKGDAEEGSDAVAEIAQLIAAKNAKPVEAIESEQNA